MSGNQPERCFVNWFITEKCNFSCDYCSIVNPRGFRGILHKIKKFVKRTPSRRFNLYDELDNVLDRFLETGMQVTFGFTGGEPFVYPRFLEICSRIIEHEEFMIALDTNLAIGDIDRFIKRVPPDKVEYIFASTHIQERERVGGGLDRFLNNIIKLKESGYRVDVNYVMYPPFFERVESDYRRFRERGVSLTIKPFKGVYRGRKYPAAYTAGEKDIIRSLSPDSSGEQIGPARWFGMNCSAGRNLVRVLSNGDVVRCAGDFRALGNILTGFELYDSSRPCIARVCPCYSPERLINGNRVAEKPGIASVIPARLRERASRLREWWHQQ